MPRGAVVLILGVLITGCASVSSSGDEKDALLRADREWATVASDGRDLDLIVSYWSDDATLIPDGEPIVRGKAAIREYVKQSLATPGFHIDWRADQAELSADGTMGYITGDNTMTVPGADGKPATILGRSLTVWRKNSHGEWKCVVDTWNSES